MAEKAKMSAQKTASAVSGAATSAAVQIKPAAKTAKAVTPAERQRMIAEAAYYLAERRGFAPGNDVQDWVEAERKVDAQLRKG